MSHFWTGFMKASDVSKEELREELRKHEERETPAQEKAESKEEQRIEREAGVEPKNHKTAAPAWAQKIVGGSIDKLKKGLPAVGAKLKEGFPAVGAHFDRNAERYLAGVGTMAAVSGARSGARSATAREKQLELQEKKAGTLTSESRDALPDSAFVYPKERKFPIHDLAHARNALARAHFAPDPDRVRKAVHAKYPELAQEKTAFIIGFEKAAAVFSIKHSIKHKDISRVAGKLRNLVSQAKGLPGAASKHTAVIAKK